MEKDREELWQAEDIAGKLMVVWRYTGLNLALLDNLGELKGMTPDFRSESLSLLRLKRQALQKNDLALFSGLTVQPLTQGGRHWGWLAADSPREKMRENDWCLFWELSLQLTFLLWHEGELNAMVRRHREQFLYDILYHN